MAKENDLLQMYGNLLKPVDGQPPQSASDDAWQKEGAFHYILTNIKQKTLNYNDATIREAFEAAIKRKGYKDRPLDELVDAVYKKLKKGNTDCRKKPSGIPDVTEKRKKGKW